MLILFLIAADIGFLDINKITSRGYIAENDETRSVSDADYSFSRITPKVESNHYSHPFMHSPYSPFRARVNIENSANLMQTKDKMPFSQESFGPIQGKRPHSMPYPTFAETYEDSCI